MLRGSRGARRYNERIVLTMARAVVDDFGHASFDEPEEVLVVYGSVRQMSSAKTMMTFQQADVVGLDIEFRKPAEKFHFNGLTWRGHEVHFPTPEEVDERGRVLRISGWYKIDNPEL